MDEYRSNPCVPMGTCATDVPNTYSCACDDGYVCPAGTDEERPHGCAEGTEANAAMDECIDCRPGFRCPCSSEGHECVAKAQTCLLTERCPSGTVNATKCPTNSKFDTKTELCICNAGQWQKVTMTC